jgi:ribonuclease HII
VASRPPASSAAPAAPPRARKAATKGKPALKRRARPGEKAAHLILSDAERGDLIAGADEAGRGCLAGPLVVAAVLLEPVRLIPLIEHDDDEEGRPPRVLNGLSRLDDSKRVPKPLRAALAASILEHVVTVAVVVRSPGSLDRDGLHRTNLAMLGEALDRVERPGAILLSDGFSAHLNGGGRSEAVIGGDGKSAAIAAASVIAKTVRDQLMRGAAHERWPDHRFDEHVGYATPTHHDAIQTVGITAIHRRSFASIAYENAPDAA